MFKHEYMYILIVFVLFLIQYKMICSRYKKKLIQKKIINNIKNNNYLLYYQPIIDSKSNNIIALETLIRQKDSNGNVLTPFYFLDEIIENGMLDKLTLWIIEKVINDYNDIKSYPFMKHNDFFISINISLKELENVDFMNKLRELSKKNNSNKICLEITESVGIDDLSKVKNALKELKDTGFLIAIDDFGVRYANLDLLQKIDFDIIKIDKYFLDDIQDSELNQQIISFISNIASLHNKAIIVEGLETKEQKDIILKLIHDNFGFQGFFYFRPMPITDLKTIEL